MLKQKFLHRKSRDTKSDWDVKKYNRGKNRYDLFSEKLPQHEPIRKKYRWHNFDTYPLEKFIESKIGSDWNDVYSEIISKTKPKFRKEIETTIDYCIVKNVFYDENFIPYGRTYRYGKNKILNDRIFIDNNNILIRKTLEEIMLESKKLLRREKLRQILLTQEEENKDNNIEDVNT
jgi:hypothetical protein